MSIQSYLTDRYFKRDEEDGRIVMFPNGVKQPGYVVPDAATEQKMRLTLMWLKLSRAPFAFISAGILLLLLDKLEIWNHGLAFVAVQTIALLMGFVGYQIIVVKTVMERSTRGMTPWSGRSPG